MSEENSLPIDILQQIDNVDLSTVETSFPLLATGNVLANIIKAEFRRDTERKGDSAKPYIYIEYSLAQPWKTVARDGNTSKVVNPSDRGSVFNERIYVGQYIDKKTGETKWYGIDHYAQLREAIFGKATPGVKINPPELIGQTVTTKLLFESMTKNKNTGETYGPRTSVVGYIRKKLT